MRKPAGTKSGQEKGKGAVAEPEEDFDLPEDVDKPDPDADPDVDKADPDADPDVDKPDPDADPDADEPEKDEDEDDPRDATIAELKSRLEALEGKGKKEEPPKQMSEEDWKKLEEQFGVAEKDGVPGSFGRQGIQQIVRLMSGMSQNFREMLNSELGGFKKESVIAELSREKGFEDIKGYRKGIEEFLKDYDSQVHSNKNLLKKAFIYARGLAAQGKFKKALNSREQQRKINPGGGHGKPTGKGGGKAVALSLEQKMAAKQAKMSEAEYIKYLTTDNLEDIDLPE